MLAYAAHRRRVAERHSAPHVMMAIVTAHIALIAAVMSARMELPPRFFPPSIKIKDIKVPPPPPPVPAEGKTKAKTTSTFIDHTRPIVPPPRPTDDQITVDNKLPPAGGGETVGTRLDPLPKPIPVRAGPRFATPASEIRPPYPPSKIASEEEAVLRLKLTIDAAGRVIAVDSVGKADPAFLAAARRHLMAHWRYKPATEDGRAMASATVITLRFELNE